MPNKAILTKAELIRRLEALPDDTIIMLDCSDEYYSGPMYFETRTATAGLFGPKQYLGPAEDERGRRITPRPYTWDGGWVVLNDDDDRDLGPILDQRAAFVLENS